MRMLIAKSAILVARSRPFQQRKPNGHPRILVLGDSTAVGTGAADPSGSTAARFAKDFPDADIQNFAVNGMRLAGLVRDFPSFPANSFDLVLLQIGANDILRHTPLPAFTASLAEAFDRARAVGTHVVALHCGDVGLAPFFRWPLTLFYRVRSRRLREVYRRIAAEKGVTYVDLFHEKTDDPFADHARFYANDLLHLNDEGYRVWYEEIRASLPASANQVLRESQGTDERVVV